MPIRAIHSSRHSEFTLSDEPGWTLVVVDDEYARARDEESKPDDGPLLGGYSSSARRRSTYMNLQRHAHASNEFCAILMPWICKGLEGVSRLVMLDFPQSTDDAAMTALKAEADKCLRGHRTAFLIDLDHGLRTEDAPFGDEIAMPILESRGVPRWLCAFWTLGSVAHPEYQMLRSLFKTGLFNRGFPEDFFDAEVYAFLGNEALYKWWHDLRGTIQKVTFDELTKKGGHNPREIPLDGDGLKVLKTRILDELRKEDGYGVWEWVDGIVSNNTLSDDERRFAYFCGKAFVSSGEDARGSSPVPAAAARALAFGLPLRLPHQDKHRIEINESRSFTTADALPIPTVPAHLDAFGTVSLYGGSFERFAQLLRDWLWQVQSEQHHGAWIETLRLVACSGELLLGVEFGGTLGLRAFSERPQGLVTRAWDNLRRWSGPSPLIHIVRGDTRVSAVEFHLEFRE